MKSKIQLRIRIAVLAPFCVLFCMDNTAHPELEYRIIR